MALFGIGGSKSKSSSNSSANTYVDRAQAPYLSDVRGQAQNLNNRGMPVEGVANINPRLNAGLSDQYEGGRRFQDAGMNMSTGGFRMAQDGYASAKRYGNDALDEDPETGFNFANNGGIGYAQNAGTAGIAQGGGVNLDMANNMRNNASQAGPSFNFGANVGNARNYGNQAMMGNAASANGFNSDVVNQAGGLASQSAGMSNQGFDMNNVSKYMNNDVLQGQIDAASRDVTRNLNENQLPGIQSAAAGSMNSGSSRTGNAIGVATRGAQDAIYDISSNIRGNAFNTGLGIEANRAQQNAQMGQQNQQFNTGAINNMASQGLGIAGNQTGMNAGFNQQTDMANQNAVNNFTGQGFGIDASRASENAGYGQQANMYNAQAGNSLLSQGYGIGSSQIGDNLSRQQQGNQFNAGAYNAARQFGTGAAANAYNSNTQANQFGANMMNNYGNQGMRNMVAGQNMNQQGNQQMRNSGQYGRDYQQQLLNNQYRQQMAPYNSLNFYNQIVGGPNNLSNSSSNSKGSSSSFNLSV